MLKDSVTQMIETMGQTIELLHTTKQSLAKKVPVPIINNKPTKPYTNGGGTTGSTPSVITLDSDRSPDSEINVDVTTDPESASISSKDIHHDADRIDCAAAAAASPIVTSELAQAAAPVGTSNGERAKEDVMSALPIHLMSMANSIVPTSSYTSSDEEDVDEFFDAEDEFSEQITLDKIADDIQKLDCGKTKSPLETNGDGMIYVDEVKVNGGGMGDVVVETTPPQVQLDVPPGGDQVRDLLILICMNLFSDRRILCDKSNDLRLLVCRLEHVFSSN